ncbi:MAG: tetraacyldisaccharide 4'-kinase, partial [Bacillota bacterium]
QNIAGEKFSLNRLNNKNVIAFSGLGNPEAFESSLEKQGCNLIKHYIFSDHHSYRPEDFKEIARRFSKGNLDYLITTGKDLVKINDAIIDFFRVQGLNLYSLEIKMAFKDQTGQAINIGESLIGKI